MKTTATVSLFLSLSLAACADDPEKFVPSDDPAPEVLAPNNQLAAKKQCNPSTLRTDLVWYGQNRETLTAWIDEAGCASEGYKHNKPPIALFDWDNTVLKNDIGDAITFYLIKNDKVVQPPNADWKKTSKYMTDAGAAALTAACGSDVAPGLPLPTSTNLGCADEMLSMYVDNKTRAGALAFGGHNFRRMEPTYAWTAQLLAGHTEEEVRFMTLAAATPMLAAPIGATQVVGTRTLNGYLRIYDQISDLIRGFQTRGYDIWVITASPNPVVSALSPMVGIPAHKVIGIRQLKDVDGRLTYSFEGCGPVADGDDSMISYIEGKRCWVNKIVYGDDSESAMLRRHEPRQHFGAGDSDTDVEFLRDSKYKLMLNRNKKEAMCLAYNNEDASWLVNPMFIAPRAQQLTPYTCSTTACLDAAGNKVPCRDEQTNVIPDQADTVF